KSAGALPGTNGPGSGAKSPAPPRNWIEPGRISTSRVPVSSLVRLPGDWGAATKRSSTTGVAVMVRDTIVKVVAWAGTLPRQARTRTPKQLERRRIIECSPFPVVERGAPATHSIKGRVRNRLPFGGPRDSIRENASAQEGDFHQARGWRGKRSV